MGTILLFSALIRVAAMGLSVWHLYRHRRWQILVMVALTGLMAARQGLTLAEAPVAWWGGPWHTELPGLLVSFLVLGAVAAYMRILQEDGHQYLYWNRIPRETGFVFADLAPDHTIHRVTDNLSGLVGYEPTEVTERNFTELLSSQEHGQGEGLPRPTDLSDPERGSRMDLTLRARDGRDVPIRAFIRFQHNPFHGRRHFSVILADRREEVQSRKLQETVADLAREAEDIIANEGWGLVHIAEQAAEALEVNRVGIWWFSPDHCHLRCTEHYNRITGHHTAGELLDQTPYPTYFQALEEHRVLAVADPWTDPRTAELAPGYLAEQGITALLGVPILSEGRSAGVVCFEHTGGQRTWNEAEAAFAGSIADLVALSRTAGRHRERAERLAHQAHLDPLTGLVNWQLLQERLHEEVVREGQKADPRLALLYIDLDQFRYINDTQGHEVGDGLLTAVAKEIIAVQPGDAVLGRVGGDEFVLAVHEADPELVRGLAARVQDGLARTALDGGPQVTLSASIGVALMGPDTRSAGDLLAGADLACNQAKEAGRNRIAFYQPDSPANTLMSERLSTFQRIRRALDRDGFQLVYQPIRGLSGYPGDLHEVLLRLQDEEGALGPGQFLPVAERFSLMGEIDRWVVEQAVARLAQWRRERPELTFSINLSARAFGDQELFDQIRDWIRIHNLAPEALVFEITETEAIANLAQAKAMIWTLRELGCRFALDDFGSGFASFAYLRELPVDLVKIDGHFIRDLPHSSLDHAIVRALVDIADNLGKEVVAEFVENSQTLAQLTAMGVHYAQGFHLGHPVDTPLPVLTPSRTADAP